ncbi:MAG: DnaB-like helicase C-terminal domain-containing protein [Clostridia bacterium]|nr:DnaB-like helicase C-terminal domain-containing protein [Clostridia bacterium]
MAPKDKQLNSKKTFKISARFPCSLEIENEVIASLINNNESIVQNLHGFTEDYFFHPLNQKLFIAIKNLSLEGNVDILNVNDYMTLHYPDEKGVMEYLGNLIKSSTSLFGTNFQEYKDILYRDMILRRINDCGKKIVEASEQMDRYEDCLSFAQGSVLKLSQELNSGNSMIPLSRASGQFLEKIEELSKNRNAFKGLYTHYKELDRISGGLKKGNLIILAARPSVGKSAFAVNIMANIIEKQEKKVIAIFSMEMPAEQIVQRLIAMLTSIDMRSVFSGSISQSGLDEVFKIHAAFGETKIFISDQSLQTPNNIWSSCKILALQEGKIDLVIVDYLQLMNYNDPTSSQKVMQLSETSEVTKNSRMLKMIAMNLGCPVLALSQLSRSIEGREKDKEQKGKTIIPKLSDLRQSGSIEQDADMVMFLAREKEDTESKGSGYIVLAIEKNRNGPLEKIMYKWDGSHVKFTEDPSKTPPMDS